MKSSSAEHPEREDPRMLAQLPVQAAILLSGCDKVGDLHQLALLVCLIKSVV